VERQIYRFLHLLFALGVLHMSVLIALELQRSVRLRSQVLQVQLRLEQLEVRNQELREELELAADPRYREGLVRQMGYVHKDELLFRLVPPAD
jgi:cell division protein FtsB